MGSPDSTLALLLCNQMDTWGSKERELYPRFNYIGLRWYPCHDYRPSSSRIHRLLQKSVEITIAAVEVTIAAVDSMELHITLEIGQGLLGLVAV